MESRPFSNIISPPTVPKWFALLASRITTPNSYILRSEFISASATNFKGISIATPFPSSTYASFCNGCIFNNHQQGNCQFILPCKDLISFSDCHFYQCENTTDYNL
ncbi:uncharacterized protein OCT59_001332 [Rhizophagus irregularis]|uniref:uncharacterized protein n=1 Tax=Rhizophagus irregularis TaxID=588596 RepID=UPI000CBF9D8E|nr:hypothetical protein OCT59_001332 [Rhizophagus irregularis]GBC29713.1 hypothetical protein RIR_jg27960.t1 [Rhizophagus irregularis DAOM 181602=DAOM 197198]CAB4487226.1 unnamed protein product [Rhizophagus irregularis]